MSFQQLMDEVLQLPETDRAALAAALIESLDADTDEEVGAAAEWDAEIRRRIDELDSGAVKPIPWAEARRIIAGESDAGRGQ